MPTVTEDNINEYCSYIDSLKSGLSSIKSGALSAANTDAIKTGFESAEATAWTDDVGVAYNARVKECKNIMDTMTATVNGGSFNQMYSCVARMQDYADEVKRLKNNKSEYARWRSNLNKESETYEKKYNDYTEKINNCNTHIEGNLSGLNSEIATLPNYHFELSDSSNSDGGGSSDSGGDSGSSLPGGAKKLDNGMILVEDYTYVDEFGDEHTASIMIDPETGNRIVVEGDSIYVTTRDYEVTMEVLAIDGEMAYTFDASQYIDGNMTAAEFLQSPQAAELLSNPEANNPADTNRFTGDQCRTDYGTGEGQTHTVQLGNDSVTFFTSEWGAADSAFNSWVNSNTDANMFNYD